jgi:hypothetical protein
MAKAFAPHVIRDGARTAARARVRREDQRSAGRHFVRRRALGTEAVYEIVEEGPELVTVEVVVAPGLAAGTRVRLLASAARAMEEVDPGQLARPPQPLRSAAGIPPRAA